MSACGIPYPDFQVTLFLNPAVEEFFINLTPGNAGQAFRLSMYDYLGREVWSDLPVSPGVNRFDAGNLAVGVYFLWLVDGAGERVVVGKVVVGG